MNLSGIIAISGKPGLFRVVAQGKNNIIVESLEEKKRFPAYAADRISALDDISIYTVNDDKPLKDIFTTIFEKENGGLTISHKEDAKKLAAYLNEILPDYDRERVYPSDVKKVFQWYNLLHKVGELKMDEPEAPKKAKAKTEKAEDGEDADPKEKKAAAPKKVPSIKKPGADKTSPKSAGKATGAKKAPTKVGGTSRGK